MLSISGISPASGANNISLDTEIEFTIVDDGAGIDTSTLVVNINGARAITGIDFQTGFAGSNSEINFVGNDLLILIHPENLFDTSQVITVQIQVQNIDGVFFNYQYTFATITEEPVLVVSSPAHNSIITGSQYLYFEFEDQIDGINADSLNIDIEGVDYIIDGEFQSELLGALSDIRDSESGDGIIVRIDLIEPFRDGVYTINYSVSDTFSNELTGQIRFTVRMDSIVLPSVFPQTGFIGFYQGIERSKDIGDGKSVEISWPQIATRSHQSEGFALIYQNTKRLDTFSGLPTYLAAPDIRSALITNLTTGTTYSFGVRAMESYVGTLDLTGMELIDPDGVYLVPPASLITEQVFASDNNIYVDSVEGYPAKGFLFIGSEIIRYNSINVTGKAFIVSTSGRGVSETTPGIYLPGDSIQLFLQCTDTNTAIAMSTPMYSDGYEYDREINNEGLVVTNNSDNDALFTIPYDFCGYHRAMPEQTLNGIDDCGSYLGGESNGFRGMNLFDRLVANEEILLNSTGEPAVLLKRIWNGQTCSCLDGRRVHPKMVSCPSCYGTGYVGGYRQYVNPRRNDTLIMASFGDTTEDLKLGSHESLIQEVEPSAWTLPVPAIRDRDLIVRFDLTGDMEFIYEVLNTTKEKAIFRLFTRQRLTIKRLDKTDPVYRFRYTKPANIGQS